MRLVLERRKDEAIVFPNIGSYFILEYFDKTNARLDVVSPHSRREIGMNYNEDYGKDGVPPIYPEYPEIIIGAGPKITYDGREVYRVKFYITAPEEITILRDELFFRDLGSFGHFNNDGTFIVGGQQYRFKRRHGSYEARPLNIFERFLKQLKG